jgi:hypothetical protein
MNEEVKMLPFQERKKYYRDKRLEKAIRWFHGKKVELPVVEKPVSNDISINPEVEDNSL